MAGGFKRIEDYDVIDPAVLPDDAVVYTVLPSESTPALIDRNWTWLAFKTFLTAFVTAVTDVVANTTHRGSDGSDHSFIDQDVKVAASPTFNNITANGYAIFDSKRITSNNYIQLGNTTLSVVYNAIVPFIPIDGDRILMTGSIYVDVLTTTVIVSKALKLDSNTIYIESIRLDTGIIFNLTVDEGSSATVNCSIAW